MRGLGTANIVQLAFFFVDLDCDLPAEEIADVEWCSDAFVSLLEELKIVLFRTRQHHTTQESGGVWFFIAATPKHQIVVSHRSDIVQNCIKVIRRLLYRYSNPVQYFYTHFSK